MYKSKFSLTVNPVSVKRRSYDTSVVSDYVINEAGHIRSDFAVLNETNDALAMQKLLGRVMAYSEVDVNKGKSLQQILSEIKPRVAETPAELDRFEKYCIDNALAFYRSLKDSDVAKLSTGNGDGANVDSSSDSSVGASGQS